MPQGPACEAPLPGPAPARGVVGKQVASPWRLSLDNADNNTSRIKERVLFKPLELLTPQVARPEAPRAPRTAARGPGLWAPQGMAALGAWNHREPALSYRTERSSGSSGLGLS